MGLYPSKHILQYKDIKIERIPKPSLDDTVVCTQTLLCSNVLRDFIRIYGQKGNLERCILERLLKELCIEEQCLENLQSKLRAQKNQNFYCENLFVFATVQEILSAGKWSVSSVQESLQILKYRKELFFQEPYLLFCEFLKFAVIHIIFMHALSLSAKESYDLLRFYFIQGFQLLLEGMLSRISGFGAVIPDVYASYSHSVRDANRLGVFAFADSLAQTAYVVCLDQSTSNPHVEQAVKMKLEDYRDDLINQLLTNYGKSRAKQLQSIFDSLSDALSVEKISYKEIFEVLHAEAKDLQHQIFDSIPTFIKQIEETIYAKNTQKKEIASMKTKVNSKNIEPFFKWLEFLNKDLASQSVQVAETPNINNSNHHNNSNPNGLPCINTNSMNNHSISANNIQLSSLNKNTLNNLVIGSTNVNTNTLNTNNNNNLQNPNSFINLNSPGDICDDTSSRISNIFSNKNIALYQNLSKTLIIQDEEGFKIRANQAMEILTEQINECEEEIENNTQYLRHCKYLLNQSIHKTRILRFFEKHCFSTPTTTPEQNNHKKNY